MDGALNLKEYAELNLVENKIVDETGPGTGDHPAAVGSQRRKAPDQAAAEDSLVTLPAVDTVDLEHSISFYFGLWRATYLAAD